MTPHTLGGATTVMMFLAIGCGGEGPAGPESQYPPTGATAPSGAGSATPNAPAIGAPACCTQIVPPDPTAVSVTGRVVDAAGAGVAGVQVLRMASDPYLQPVLRAQSANDGTFSMDGVAGDTRQWLMFTAPGYVGLLQAFDTTGDPRQALPEATLIAPGDAAAIARGYGVALDPTRATIRVPVVAMVGGHAQPAQAGDFQFIASPALDAPISSTPGEALVFNATADSARQVTVMRAGRRCVPEAHPTLVANDGSTEIAAVAGYWTVGPTMVCP